MEAYWKFINRDLPDQYHPTGFESIEFFYEKTIIWTIFFCFINLITPVILKFFYPKWYDSLNSRKKNELPPYISCLVHHIVVVPRSWKHLYDDFFLDESLYSTVSYPKIESSIAPFCFGYLIGDTICYALPEALSFKFEFLIHHILSLWLTVSSQFAHGGISRYIPHLIINDTTNLFFNTAWLLRLAGYKGSMIVTILEVLFAISFFFVRVINFPLVFVAVCLKPQSIYLGYSRFTMGPICLLQWYWFYLIIKGLRSRFVSSKTVNLNDKNETQFKVKSQ